MRTHRVLVSCGGRQGARCEEDTGSSDRLASVRDHLAQFGSELWV